MDSVHVRSRILDAALALLAEGGDVTQTRVSKAAGIRQSHLTYYFPTINALLQAVARHSIETLTAQIAPAKPPRHPRAVADLIAHGTSDKRRVRVMLALVAAADRDASLKPQFRRFLRELRAAMAATLRLRGIDADAADLAFLHSAIVGAAVLQLARDNAEARAEARATIGRALECLSSRGGKR